MKASAVAVILLSATLAWPIACMLPAAEPYQPLTDREAELLTRARRDVLPEDVRSGERAALVAWTGILRKKTSSNGVARFAVDHRYWDWIDDYGTQSTRVFLSPRGEGLFHFAVGGDEGRRLLEQAQQAQMLVVYGVPKAVDPDGAIELRYVHARGIPESMYATDVWDYGRGTTDPEILRIDAF